MGFENTARPAYGRVRVRVDRWLAHEDIYGDIFTGEAEGFRVEFPVQGMDALRLRRLVDEGKVVEYDTWGSWINEDGTCARKAALQEERAASHDERMREATAAGQRLRLHYFQEVEREKRRLTEERGW